MLLRDATALRFAVANPLPARTGVRRHAVVLRHGLCIDALRLPGMLEPA